MRTFKLFASLFALSAPACRECTLECDNNIIVDVSDSNGSIVSDFVVTATVQGVDITVDCGGAHNKASTGTVQGESVRVRCREAGIFLIENVTNHDYAITVSITGNGQSFTGSLVDRSVETRDVNNTDCGECTYASPRLQ
jgi:hypothetical protein